MTDTDMLYMASLEKRNAELEAKIAELEDKHHNECRQIAHYDGELRKDTSICKTCTWFDDGACRNNQKICINNSEYLDEADVIRDLCAGEDGEQNDT